LPKQNLGEGKERESSSHRLHRLRETRCLRDSSSALGTSTALVARSAAGLSVTSTSVSTPDHGSRRVGAESKSRARIHKLLLHTGRESAHLEPRESKKKGGRGGARCSLLSHGTRLTPIPFHNHVTGTHIQTGEEVGIKLVRPQGRGTQDTRVLDSENKPFSCVTLSSWCDRIFFLA
jgi:hypothetical protein